jgi:solute carrier family 25 iron transporter 28/37
MDVVETVMTQMFAGAVAGAIADCFTHPLSTVKTRLQCQGAMLKDGAGGSAGGVFYKGPISGMAFIARTEGFRSLYKGIGIVVAGAAPGQALYFAGYETVKRVGGSHPVTNFLGGVTAQICGSLAWVPMDVVKERLQIEGQIKTVETYGGSMNALRQIVAKEGFMGLYRAYWLHQLTWAPFNGLYFTCFEATRNYVRSNNIVPDGIPTNLISGMIAGMVASVSTSPIDLVKTRLQVQKSNPQLFDYKVY